MKNLIWVLIVTLFVWNILLSAVIFSNKENTTTNSDNGEVVINNEVNGFSTDLTDVVANVESKVVTIYAKVGDNEYNGSGFIYSFDENYIYVVTNNHVIDSATDVTVKFNSGESLTAEVLANDEYYDIAMLRVKKDFNVDTIKLGDSSLVKKGEFVIAVGSPIDESLDGSVNVGVVSGINRLLPIDIDNNGTTDFSVSAIQTDADINQGNSGGPLINMAGELIGINSSELKSDIYDYNISFAIEVNEIKPILLKMINGEKIIHPSVNFEGKNISQFTNYQKSYYGISLDTVSGIYVSSVVENSNFAKANLQKGDIILKINEISIDSIENFKIALFNYDIGDIVNLTVLRDSEEVNLAVEIE